MLNIKERMDDVVRENGLRGVAKECKQELENNKPLNDVKRKSILSKYLNKFTTWLSPDQLNKTTVNIWLSVYVEKLHKEEKHG
ncbi:MULTISPECIES: hypothetical protein [unclassified Providencia]|nr:hypothetical protein [Providencia sp. PROV040]WOB87321.1 hypothetical protein P3L40_05395 [Providencia sp. PROV040]